MSDKRINLEFFSMVFVALVGLFAVLVLASGILTGCNGTTYHEQAASQEPPTYTSLQATVFSPSCISCHGTSFKDLTSYAAVMKYVAPGNPDASPLYLRIASGSMPPSGKLPDSYIRSVRQWIISGAPQF